METSRHTLHRTASLALIALLLVGSAGVSLATGGEALAVARPTLLDVPTPTSCDVLAARPLTLNRWGFMTIRGNELTRYARRSDWAITLLDPQFRLPSDYAPASTSLTWIDAHARLSEGRGWQLKRDAAVALRAMFLQAREDAGLVLRVISAYRPYELQNRLLARLAARRGINKARTLIAIPGHSEHQLGTTVDLRGYKNGAWMAANAYRFGFVRSYLGGGRQSETCYASEPWHWRYVGTTIAYEVACSEQVLRIFLWERQHGADRVIGPNCGELTPPDDYPTPEPSPDPSPSAEVSPSLEPSSEPVPSAEPSPAP